MFCCCDRSSTWVRREVLGCIREGGGLDATDLAVVALLLLDEVGVHVGLLGGGGVFDVVGQFDAPVVVALVAVLSDLSVCFRIEIFRLDCWDVPHVPGHMRLPNVTVLLPLLVLSRRLVAHIAHNCVFL